MLTYFEVEDAPFFLLRFSEQGRLHQAERELAQSVCCFEAGTLLGTSLDQLVPRAPGRNHEQLRESFNAQPSVRAMGAHRGDLEARR